MSELGIRQIFARSPQAKGRVERAAGTYQDRLVTELRLAGTKAMEDANAVLKEFLVRFNERFRVPAQQPKAAYRPFEPALSLERIFCFKHRRKVAGDNTVKYRLRTPQLLPGKGRPSYAGGNSGSVGGPRRQSLGAVPGRDHLHSGGAGASRHSPCLQ